jgi:MYXO-CTERM domain-containing protein
MKKLGLGLVFAALLWSSSGFAFCRATTCNPLERSCATDPRTECTTTGSPLAWVSGCVTINVQRDGAPGAGVSADDAEASVRRALDAWLGADCGNGFPSIAVEVGSQVKCDVSEYEGAHHNANIVMFREQVWPYEGGEDALGVTRLRFDDDQAPGQLWDADIELNAVDEPLAVGSPASNQVDLDSLITHEMGHFFGLGHSLVTDATMIAGYMKGSTGLRTLSADDVAGICAIYPPGRELNATSCEPRHGFSELCAADQPPFVEPHGNDTTAPEKSSKGCTTAPGTPSGTLGAAIALVAAAAVLRRRR